MQATGAHSGRLRPLLIYDQNPVRVTPAAAGAPKIKGTPLRPAQWGEDEPWNERDLPGQGRASDMKGVRTT